MRYQVKQKNNKTGKTGVIWNENAKKYEVYIYKEGRKIYLGIHSDFDVAVKVRLKAEERYHRDDPSIPKTKKKRSKEQFLIDEELEYHEI